MPLLFSVGHHAALEATQRRPRQDEPLFAFWDDIYFAPQPETVGDVHNVVEREVVGSRKHPSPILATHVWNRSGRVPPACDELQRGAVLQTAQVWTGSPVPDAKSGHQSFGMSVGSRGSHREEAPRSVAGETTPSRRHVLRAAVQSMRKVSEATASKPTATPHGHDFVEEPSWHLDQAVHTRLSARHTNRKRCTQES